MAKDKVIDNESTTGKVSDRKRFIRVFLGRKVVVFGLVVILILILLAILAPVLTPYDPNETSLRENLLPPSAEHWLGTDALGRDLWSRLLYGARTSLVVGITVIAIASIVGIVLGLLAGYYKGAVHTIIMRIIDVFMTFPMIVLAMVIAAMLGGGMKNVIIALSVSLMPQYARLMCGQVLQVKQNDYILAEKSLGATDLRILAKHIFANALPPLIVLMTMMIGHAILSEASLSFLGIGIAAPTASWGGMVNSGKDYLASQPWMTFAPGIAIMLVVFAFNMVGDGLRDALDPKLRGKI